MSLRFGKFPIVKVAATGNDFLLIDLLSDERKQLWNLEWSQQTRSELTKKWCDRHEGLGADGLVVIEPEPGVDFKWDFYNSDGGSAELCGNAARAVGLYVQQVTGKTQLSFSTRAGTVSAHVHSGEKIEVELPAIAESSWGQRSASNIEFDFVRAGVPHAVVRTQNIIDHKNLRAIAMEIKNEPRFQKDGVNVTFVQPVQSQHLKSVTFERGVEDFTLACGTGAVSAAFSVTRGLEDQQIEVEVPGGRLFVVWKNGRPRLLGPAKISGQMFATTT